MKIKVAEDLYDANGNFVKTVEFYHVVDVEKFDRILDLEHDVRGEKASVAFAPTGLPLYLVDARQRNLETARKNLFTAVDNLTADEMTVFGEYRQEVLCRYAVSDQK